MLANRLSEDRTKSVLLVEAGIKGKESLPVVKAPGGVIYLAESRFFNWGYKMEPDPTCNNYSCRLGAGKLLGGGSSVNGMMFIRGNAEDYNEWSALGNKGWAYKEVLPFFKKTENTTIGEDEYHGRLGPLGVEYANPMLEVSNLFIRAAIESGIKNNPDINGAVQDGISRTPCSTQNGIRQSTAIAYLQPVKKRKNLKVITGAVVKRIIFKADRAVGVELLRGGRNVIEEALNEIVLSAGAIRSPQLLMLSGVGRKGTLDSFSIPQLFNVPGVGLNHMEHPAAYVMYEMNLPSWCSEISLYKQFKHGLNWLFFKEGPANSGMSQAVAFVRSEDNLNRPDIQLTLIPFGLDPKNKKNNISSRNVVLVIINDCQPGARGKIDLASGSIRDHPRIYPQLLGTEKTIRRIIEGVKIVRKIFNAAAIKPYVIKEIVPGVNVNTADHLEAWLRSSVIDTVHPSGTCKMGQDDLAVVDERLRVKHILNLRVIDASIMPTITTGNTNAPTIMIAEKGADMIIQDNM